MKVKLDPGAFMPERAFAYDAGYDLRTPKEFLLPPSSDMGDGWQVIDTGVHIEIPPGHVGFLKSKSGLNVNYCITSDGTIDSGYTGSIRVKLYNHGNQWKHFKAGDKISQIVILPIITPDLELVDNLPETDRGDNGFGSTGK